MVSGHSLTCATIGDVKSFERDHLVDEDVVRQQARALLAAIPASERHGARWLGAAYDMGLAWVSFPRGLGGLGVAHQLQAAVEHELGADDATLREATQNVVGFGI